MKETPIDFASLDLRARGVLHALGIQTLEQLEAIREEDCLRVPNCGRKTAQKIGELIGGWQGVHDRIKFGLSIADFEAKCASIIARAPETASDVLELQEAYNLSLTGHPLAQEYSYAQRFTRWKRPK